MDETLKAKERLSVILRVMSGDLQVTQAAQQLGISRKSYYQWQDRALIAMKDALTDRPAGRPALAQDTEKEALRVKVEDLTNELELAKQTIEVKNILNAYAAQQKSHSNDSKMPGKKKRRRKKR